MLNRLITILFLSIIIIGCGKQVDPEYVKAIDNWHNERETRLTKPDGWLSLVGLIWLEQGENKFGSSKENDIVFPDNAPAFIGSYTLSDEGITVKINDDVEIKIDSEIIKEKSVAHDQQENTTLFEFETLKWYLIKRGDRIGIRLKDSASKTLTEFDGIGRFDVDPSWRITGTYVKYDSAKSISIPNILGTINESPSPGYVKFTKNDKEYRFDAIDSGSKLFFVFADLTSGEETYGAGRFLYVDKPVDTDSIIIDFNKSYNPPCAFTKHATCPLPPEQNKLRLRIEAGEKNFKGAGH